MKFDVVIRVNEKGELVHVYPFPVSGVATKDWVKNVIDTSKGTDSFYVIRVDKEMLDEGDIGVERVGE
jgi:hypothetical protein